MRLRKCHKCPNTFVATNGWRRLCDACRAIPKSKDHSKRELRKRKREYGREYRRKNRWLIREYNREWMRRFRANKREAT